MTHASSSGSESRGERNRERIRERARSGGGPSAQAPRGVLLGGILGGLVVLLLLPTAGLVPGAPLDSAATAPTAPSNHGTVPAVAPRASAPTGPYWTNVTGSAAGALPTNLVGSLAYDAADGYLVFFGIARGSDGYEPLAQTWTYASGAWINLTANLTASPSPRYGEGFAYDAADGYLVLFGGFDPESSANSSGYGHPTDTWTFVGGQWTDRTATAGAAPPPEFGPAMTYDASAGVVLLAAFNRTAATHGDSVFETWTYHAGAWTHQPAGTGALPGGREQATLAYDPADRESVLFGGTYVADNTTTGLVYNDTWVYRSGSWANVTAVGAPAPFPSERPATAIAPGGHPILIGGYDPAACQYGLVAGCTPNATWLFDNGTWNNLGSLAPVAPPLGAAQQDSLAWDPATNATVLVGDQSSGVWWFRWNESTPVALLTPHGTGASPGATLNVTVVPLGGTPPYNLTLCSGGSPCVNRSSVATSDPSYWLATFPLTGSQTASVRVTDANGSIGVNGFVVPVFASNGTLAATIAIDPQTGFVPLNTTIWVNATGGAAPVTTEIAYGDGTNGTFASNASPFHHAYGCGPVVNGSYFSACEYGVTVVVTDAVGASVRLSMDVEACATNQPSQQCLLPATAPPGGAPGWESAIPHSPPYLGAYGLLGASGGLAVLGVQRDRRSKERREADQLRGELLQGPGPSGREPPRP